MLKFKMECKILLVIVFCAVNTLKAQNLATNAGVSTCENNSELYVNPIEKGHSGQWSVETGSAQFQNPNANYTHVSNLAPGKNLFAWTEYSADKAQLHTEHVVIFNHAIVADAGEDLVVTSSSAQLNASLKQDEMGEWSITAGSGVISDVHNPLAQISKLPLGITKLKWTTRIGACTASDEVVIQNNNEFIVNAGTDMVICTNNVMLKASNVSSDLKVKWFVTSGSGVFENANTTQTGVSNLAHGKNTFVLKVYNPNDVLLGSDEVVVVNQEVVANGGADQSISGSLTTLEAIAEDGVSGFWTTTSPVVSILNPKQPITQVSNLPSGSTTFTWTVTNGNCRSAYDVVVTSKVTPAPIVNAGIDQIICDDVTELNASPLLAGQTGLWTGSEVVSFSSATSPQTSVLNLPAGRSVLVWSVYNEKEELVGSDEVVVEVSFLEANAGSFQFITNNKVQLSAQLKENEQGYWVVLSGSAVIEDVNNSKTTAVISSETATLRWKIVRNGCSTYDDLSITKIDLPEVNAGTDLVVCRNAAMLIAAALPVGYTGTWSVNSGTGLFENVNQAATLVNGLSIGSNSFIWSVYNANQELVGSDEVNVTNSVVFANAGVDLDTDQSFATLNAAVPNQGVGVWTSQQASVILNNPNNATTTVSNLVDGDNLFTWTVTNNSCQASDDVKVVYSKSTVLVVSKVVNRNDVKYTLKESDIELVFDQYFSGEVSLYTLKGSVIQLEEVNTSLSYLLHTSVEPGIYILKVRSENIDRSFKLFIP